MAIFTDVIYADKVGGSKKVQSYADVIHGMTVEKLWNWQAFEELFPRNY